MITRIVGTRNRFEIQFERDGSEVQVVKYCLDYAHSHGMEYEVRTERGEVVVILKGKIDYRSLKEFGASLDSFFRKESK